MEVRFENICVTARVLVGEHGRPTLLNYYSSGIAVSIDHCIRRLPKCNVVPSSSEAQTLLCSMSWLPTSQAHECSYVHAMQATCIQVRTKQLHVVLHRPVGCDGACKVMLHSSAEGSS